MKKANLIKDRLTATERRKLHSYVRKQQGNLKTATERIGYSVPTIKCAIAGMSLLEDKIKHIREIIPTLD